MAGSVPAGDRYPVWHASTFRQRLVGIAGVAEGDGILVRASSVHGMHQRRPLQVIWLDDRGTIVGRATLLPGRIAVCREATWAVELPMDRAFAGERGDAIELVQCSASCPEP
jgi:uncharacterized membrane protein (UPF0127 family)